MKRGAVGRMSTEEALAYFDALAPVDLGFMTGLWQGAGFETDHPMDGLLEACHWYGKRFDTPDRVDPLIFSMRSGRRVRLNPGLLGVGLRLADRGWMPKAAVVGRLFQWLMPLLATSRPRARLRMIAYRGSSTAAMIYDQLPIRDVFRRIDDDAVLGLMDRKGMTRPFFFILRRVCAE